MRTSVCVKTVVRRGERILIVRRSEQDPIGPGDWEFPGGTVEWEETCEEALARELREETGLKLTDWKLLYVSSFLVEPDRKMYALTYESEAEGEVCLSKEHQAYCWADEEEAAELLLPGVYRDYSAYRKRMGEKRE